MDEAVLVKAIEISGYPLQGVVAAKLGSAGFVVTEEWGFIDADTREHRTLDISAYKVLAPRLTVMSTATPSPRIALLTECKRSSHPFVFFKRASELELDTFPVVSAIRKCGVELQTTDGKVSGIVPAQKVLGLDTLGFTTEPPRCAAFSKATPNAKKIELSGTEPFNGIVLPLVKALQYRLEIDRVFFDSASPLPTLSLCLCVLDAPMLLVESPTQAGDPILTPWVRIVRLQANQDSSRTSHHFYAIDVVHIDA